MARSLTSGMVTAMLAADKTPFWLVWFEFASGALRPWNGYGPLVWNGETWTGSAALLSLSPIVETSLIKASGVNLVLSGLDASIISLAETEDYSNRLVHVYIGAFDAAGAIIVDPYEIRRGLMDVMTTEETGETATVRLSVANILVGLASPRKRQYTPADQALEFPGDKFFDFVAALQTRQVVWKLKGAA